MVETQRKPVKADEVFKVLESHAKTDDQERRIEELKARTSAHDTKTPRRINALMNIADPHNKTVFQVVRPNHLA